MFRLFDAACCYRVWQLAWPMIVANISIPLLGVVDAAILGHLPSSHYLGAVALSASLFGFIYWGFGFLRMGTTGLTAQAYLVPLEPEDGRKLRLLLGQSLMVAVLLGILIYIVSSYYFAAGLSLMDASFKVADTAYQYCLIRINSAPFVLMTYALTGWLIGVQQPNKVLVIMVSANITNIILDVVLVIGFGLDVKGVAYATVIAEIQGFLVALYYVLKTLDNTPSALDIRALFDIKAYSKLIAVNRDLFIRTICLLFSFAFFNAVSAQQGDDVLAANALLINLLYMVAYGLDGFAQASESLAGQAIGQKKLTEFHAIVFNAGLWSLAAAIIWALVLLLMGQTILSWMTDIVAVIDLARQYLVWLTVLPLIAVWCYLFDGVFIGATQTGAMRDTLLISTFAVFLPVYFLLKDYDNHGLWVAFCLFNAARGIGLGWVFWRYNKLGVWARAEPESVV